MTVRKLDENGDIATSGVQFIHDQDEISQTVKTRLMLFLGEYFRDIADGTPWFQQILGKGSSLTAKEAALKMRMARTEGVVQLTRFSAEFDPNTRKYSVSAGILTKFGEVSLEMGKII